MIVVPYTIAGMLGATGATMDSFVEEMLELQKAIIPEHNPKKTKAGLDLVSLAASAEAYKGMRTIGVIRLVLQKYAGVDRPSLVLACINDARNLKGHRGAKSLDDVLDEYSLSRNSPRAAYLMVLARLLVFLRAFAAATEAALDIELVIDGRPLEDDPWQQMEPAVRYLIECVRRLDPPPPSPLSGLV